MTTCFTFTVGVPIRLIKNGFRLWFAWGEIIPHYLLFCDVIIVLLLETDLIFNNNNDNTYLLYTTDNNDNNDNNNNNNTL